MVALVCHPLLHRLPPPSRRNRRSIASMGSPHLPRDLTAGLLYTIEARIGSQLLPSSVSPDVLSFRNHLGTSNGALDIRSGRQHSSVDFILESWLHCEIPTGSLNIATIFAFLNDSTDAPHLLVELIQSSPTSLILFVDLLPRKDLVLHPDYLHEFYHDTNLDEQRQQLARLPQVQPYVSSSLYIRSVLSPTAIAVDIDCGSEEEIVSLQIESVLKEIVRIWLDKCVGSIKQLGEADRSVLRARDKIIKNKTVEIDLAANLPRLFGSDVAGKVVGEIQKAFGI